MFYGHCFYCTNFGHKVADFKAYGRNVQERNYYVAPHNIECYKCHNYGHIARDCRRMMDTYMKRNTDIEYKKVWKIKQDEENSTEKKKDVRYRKVWKITERK